MMIRLSLCLAIFCLGSGPAVADHEGDTLIARQLSQAMMADRDCPRLTLNRAQLWMIIRHHHMNLDSPEMKHIMHDAALADQAVRDVSGLDNWCRKLQSHYGPDGTLIRELLSVSPVK